MSYSFSVSGADANEAKAAIGKQFDQIVQQQPVHTVDRDAAQDAVDSFVDLAGPLTGSQRINVSAYGSVTVGPANGDDATAPVTSLSVNISVSVV